MADDQHILDKLERFIRKFYTNELIRGLLLFLTIGLLYLLLLTGLEYAFWFGPRGRQLLFWLFLSVEFLLWIRFILMPVLKLFRISKGIDYTDAATIIGNYFPEVEDELINLLQLKDQLAENESELLLAGIAQKTEKISPIPFQLAVDFKNNRTYIRYLLIPLLIVLWIWVSGKAGSFGDSYQRMLHYTQVYEPPAPFHFEILNEDLQVQESDNFTLRVTTTGTIAPEEIEIQYAGQTYLLAKETDQTFYYTFQKPAETTDFILRANAVQSRPYTLSVIRVPHILDFEIDLDYPAYIRKKNTTLTGTGNMTIPEGTTVHWRLKSRNTDKIEWTTTGQVFSFQKEEQQFTFKKTFTETAAYKILTSNSNAAHYEQLQYSIKIIKDRFPEIEVEALKDTLNDLGLVYHGKISDDYGLKKLDLVYYPQNDPKSLKRVDISLKNETYESFWGSFPDSLRLADGQAYELFFEVTDNDAVNGFKKSRSAVFHYYKPTDQESADRNLQEQKENMQALDRSLKDREQENKEWDELKNLQKEKNKIDYQDQKRFAQQLKNEKLKNEQLKEHAARLEKNLDRISADESREKEQLKERLEETRKNMDKNNELLKELEKYRNKLTDENMTRKLEDFSKQQKSQQRNLESLLELTKRYYVDQKAAQLSRQLKQLGEEQDKLRNSSADNNPENQEKINQAFDHLEEALRALDEENNHLRRPKELGLNEPLEKTISQQLEKILKELQYTDNEENKHNNSIKNQQKSAADMMKDLSSQMQRSAQQGGQEQLQEDIDMLRQILDNLLVFSFSQEELMQLFAQGGEDNPDLGKFIRRQQVLKENFQHVDDSLYTLALRNTGITNQIIEKIEEVDFNMDKSLTSLSKNSIQTGTSYQQYVLTGANDLANFLDDALQQMEMDMSGAKGASGSPVNNSGSEEFQLDDLIRGQEELQQGNQSGEGQDPKGDQSGTNGNDGDEQNYETRFEMYKQQARLRMELENLIDRFHLQSPETDQLLKEMENMEESLLNGNTANQERMSTLIDRLLKLKESFYEKEKDNRRRATTNTKDFEPKKINTEEEVKKYFFRDEILDRQSLPLQLFYKQLLQEYFKNG